MRKSLIYLILFVVVALIFVLFAYRGTWGKTDIEFRIHINQQLVMESAYGEPPTFAIWLEDPLSGNRQTVFATRRAAEGDWEGKAEVPVALPLWYDIYMIENATDKIPNYEDPAPVAITGATPQPGYFTTRARVDAGSNWICWIEVNLSGDYNDHFQEYDPVRQIEDEYGSGQPAIVYRGEISGVVGNITVPEIAGMSIPNTQEGEIIQPLVGVTTARNIFDEISIVALKPNPKIITR